MKVKKMYSITPLKKTANKVGTFITQTQKLFIYQHEEREDLKCGVICGNLEQVFNYLRKVVTNDIERNDFATFEDIRDNNDF